MTTVKEQKGNNGGGAYDLGAEVNDLAGQLLVNVRRDFQVRFSLRSLADAVSGELYGRLLSALSDREGDEESVVRAVLARLGIARAEGASFGLTVFGEGSIVDVQGNHAFFYVRQEYGRNGMDAALQRINGLRRQYFNQRWVEERAADIMQGVLDGLNGVLTYGSHQRCLSRVRELVEELAGAVDEQLAVGLQGRAGVEQRLEASRMARQQSRQPAGRGRVRDLYDRVRRAAVSAQSAPDTFLEGELVRLNTRLAVLEAEKAVLDEVAILVGEELRVDETSAGALDAARRNTLDEARRAEWTRDYGMAGGELLLNSRALTGAVITHVWGADGADALVGAWRAEYAARHGGEDLMTATGGELTADTLEELKDIVRDEVTARLRGLTIVDAVVALQAHGELDLQGRLKAAFRETSSLQSLLAPYYERALSLQCFASVTYAPSALPGANQTFDRMMEGVKGTLSFGVETSNDHLDSECLLFYCEYFCVPLFALSLYADSYEEFKKVWTSRGSVPTRRFIATERSGLRFSAGWTVHAGEVRSGV
jgi:hypothetical protein